MKLYNKSQLSWISYDFANSAYHLLIPTILFPLYFKKALAVGVENTDLMWSVMVSIPIFISAIIAPFIGSYMDKKQIMKPFFVYVTLITIFLCFTLGAISIKESFYPITVFMLGMFFFNLSQFSYNSFLPFQQQDEGSALLSGVGWGLGYLGGILCMLPILSMIEGKILPENYQTYQYSFIVVGVFYLVFSIPSLFFMRAGSDEPKKQMLHSSGFKDVVDVLTNWKENKNLIKFLISIYLVNDGLATLVFFTSIFASETLGLTTKEIFSAFLIVQIVAIPMTIFTSWLAEKYDYKKLFIATIMIWILISFIFLCIETREQFYYLAVLVGFVIGSTPSIARAILSRYFAEHSNAGKLFGFHAFASRASSILGPLTFGLVSTLTGSQSIALGSLILFFGTALILLISVEFKHGNT